MKVDKENQPHYYSDRLMQKLNKLCSAPAAIIEAPSGYGKTTAIRDFLESGLLQDAPVYWFTGGDEAPASAFRRLCREIEKIDGRAGERLLKIELPNAATVGEACDVLRSIECRHETYLVLDNFQFLQPALPQAFLTAILEHGGKGLHIILVTQMMRRDMLAVIAGHGVLHITTADLRLDEEDIRRYFALAGADAAAKDAHIIARRTEGWVIAVYLQLCAYRETGALSDVSGILTLMEHLVWDPLTERKQVFLLHLSPFETVTVQQACILTGHDALPDYAKQALESLFIRYEPAERRYELHSILSELLVRKRGERGAAFERECLLRAGDYCRDDGKPDKALDFYVQIGDYERMLSLDLSSLYFASVGTVPFYELALEIATKCPAKVKQRFPLSMLRIAYALLTAGMDEAFGALLDELYPMLDKSGGEDPLLLGEWWLLSSFRALPNLDEMTSALRQAANRFNRKVSRVITPDAPWCYGVYFPFAVFHAVPGQAEREADALEAYIALYSELTNGHGSGADVLYRVELAHYRGNLHEAEILAYKALFIAQSRQQKAIMLAATLHLGEIALASADTAGWRHAVNSLDSSPGALQTIFALPSALDTARGMLLSELGQDDEVADWLKTGNFTGRQLPAMKGDRMMLFLGNLLSQGKYAQLIGIAEGMYPNGVLLHSFQDAYLALLMAVSHLRLGNREKASEYVSRAVRAAVPDGLFSQLLYYGSMLGKLVEECIERDFPAQRGPYEAVRKGFLSAYAASYPDLFPNELPGDLTAREREVALLAAQGLRNSEIAEKLIVTENTIRFHLRAVFQKLDIDRRTKLAEKLK